MYDVDVILLLIRTSDVPLRSVSAYFTAPETAFQLSVILFSPPFAVTVGAPNAAMGVAVTVALTSLHFLPL